MALTTNSSGDRKPDPVADLTAYTFDRVASRLYVNPADTFVTSILRHIFNEYAKPGDADPPTSRLYRNEEAIRATIDKMEVRLHRLRTYEPLSFPPFASYRAKAMRLAMLADEALFDKRRLENKDRRRDARKSVVARIPGIDRRVARTAARLWEDAALLCTVGLPDDGDSPPETLFLARTSMLDHLDCVDDDMNKLSLEQLQSYRVDVVIAHSLANDDSELSQKLACRATDVLEEIDEMITNLASVEAAVSTQPSQHQATILSFSRPAFPETASRPDTPATAVILPFSPAPRP